MLALSDAAETALITSGGLVVVACIGLLGILLQRQTNRKLDTGNGHSIGEGVANLEREHKALSHLMLAHLHSNEEYMKTGRKSVREQRYMDANERALKEYRRNSASLTEDEN